MFAKEVFIMEQIREHKLTCNTSKFINILIAFSNIIRSGTLDHRTSYIAMEELGDSLLEKLSWVKYRSNPYSDQAMASIAVKMVFY